MPICSKCNSIFTETVSKKGKRIEMRCKVCKGITERMAEPEEMSDRELQEEMQGLEHEVNAMMSIFG